MSDAHPALPPTNRAMIAAPECVAQPSADESILPHAGKSSNELPAVYPHEASLRDFIEAATIAIHSVSGDGTILWANQAELDLLGYKREDYIGRNIADFHADQPVIHSILLRLSHGETLREYPARLRCKDGSIRHVAIDSSVLFENGEFIHTHCITRDVTRQIAAEQKLRGAEKWYRELIEALPVAVYTTDAAGRVTLYNQEAAKFAGRHAQSGMGQWCVTHHLYNSDGTLLPYEESPMAITLRIGEPSGGVEAIAERPDGTRVLFHSLSNTIKGRYRRYRGRG